MAKSGRKEVSFGSAAELNTMSVESGDAAPFYTKNTNVTSALGAVLHLCKKSYIMNNINLTFRVITAKFGSKCAETKKRIKSGDIILYNPATKRTWCSDSKKYQSFIYSSPIKS